MNTKTFYFVVSASPNAMAQAPFPTRELADAQASIWNFRYPHDLPYVVCPLELPTERVSVAEAA